MKRLFRSLTSTAIAGATLTLSLSGIATATTATPPFEPTANSVGALVFYNSSGQEVTGGSLTSSPLAAYVQGTSSIETGDTKATLYAFTPVNGVAPGSWSGEQLSSATVFPNSSAPTALASSALPLVSGSASDESLSTYISNYPNSDTSSTDGYANVYQLRLKTSKAGSSAPATFDSADIEVTGSTWSVVYPAPAVTTVTTTANLAVSPQTSSTYGSPVTLTDTISPSSAAGLVQFFDGTTPLGSAVSVVGGVATYVTSSLGDGAHSLSATFTPNSLTAFTADSSASVGFNVAAQTTQTSLAVSKSTALYGTKILLLVHVSPASALGKVQYFNGASPLGLANVDKGVASLVLANLNGGTHSFSATFISTNAYAFARSTSVARTVKISADPTSTALITSRSTAVFHQKVVMVSRVSPSASGAMWFYDGTKGLGTAPIKSGKATLVTAKLAVGKNYLHSVFHPSNSANDKMSTSKVVRVVVAK